jgi:nitroreductase
MAMQRAWLKAASLGLAVQPLSGFIFLLNHLEKTELEDFSPTHRQLLHEVYTRLKKVELLEDSKQLVMFFRMGYPKREAFRTGRRVVSDVLFSP